MSHIKLYGITPRVQYVADGTLATYEFPFVIFNATDVRVYLNNVLQTTDSYTVSGVKNSDGGAITFTAPPTLNTAITITRNLTIERTTDFQDGGALRADALNDEFDYQTACLQQVADSINRSMVLPPYATDTDVDLTLPTPSAGKAIVWNSDGTNLENSAIKVNELESVLRGYKETAQSASAKAISAATMATEEASIASEQAQIATQKASEATEQATEVANALSTKANTDMDNLTEAGIATITSFGMPSDTYIDITTGTIAPANGFFVLSGYSTASHGFGNIYTTDEAGDTVCMASTSGPNPNHGTSATLPVSKGQKMGTQTGNYALKTLRFYYAQGEI